MHEPGCRVSPPTSLKRRFGSALLWNAVGTLGLQGGTFVTNLLVANLLGTTEYGRYGFLIGTAQTIASVLQLCAGMAANKYAAQYRKSDPGLARAILEFLNRLSIAMGLLGSLFLMAFALTAADTLTPFVGLGGALAVSAPVVLCTVLNGYQLGAIAGLEGFQKSARAVLPLMILQLASTGAAAAWSGLQAALLAMSLNFAVRAWICGRLLQREMAAQGLVTPKSDPLLLRRIMIDFMLPGSLAGLTNMPSLWLATAALTKHQNGFTEVGLFNAAFALRALLMILPWIVNSVGFSLLNAHLGSGHRSDYKRILATSLLLCGTAAGVGALLVLAFSSTLLRAYGPDFEGADAVLRVLMLSLVAEALAWPLYQALASRHRVWLAVLCTQMPRDLAIAGLGIFLVGQHGAVGLAWAHTCGWTLALLGCTALLVATPRASSNN